jgi:hypothetical protein
MPNWLNQGGTPITSRANPGKHLELRVAFANGAKSWEETADIMKTWPDRGVEFRKQYGILQNQPEDMKP